MQTHSRVLFVVGAVILSIAYPQRSDAQDMQFHDFLKGYNTTYPKLASAYDHIQGTLEVRNLFEAKDRESAPGFLVSFALCGEMRKLQRAPLGTMLEKINYMVAVGQNRRYGFVLDSESLISPFRMNRAEAKLDTTFMFDGEVNKFLRSPLASNGVRFHEMFSQAAFTPRSLKWTEIEGRRLLQLDFEFPEDRAFFNIKEGKILFDPQRQWLSTHSESRLTDAAKGYRIITKCVFGAKTIQGVPVPDEVTVDISGIGERSHCKCLDLKECDLTDQAFTLTAFGLPEPVASGDNSAKR